VASRRDPRDFGDMPSTRLRKTRGHPLAALPPEPDAPADMPDMPDVSDKPGTPDKSGYKARRMTRGGEDVRRATYWLTDDDLETVMRLQRVLRLSDTPGVPDKSSVVREAIRRLAACELDGKHQGSEDG
jgi:hypothetical protein